MNKIVNLSLFIIPNSGRTLKNNWSWGLRSDLRRLHELGVPADENTTCLQVWVHCPEENLDNCTDHGYSKSIIRKLSTKIENDPAFTEYEYNRAPSMFPIDILRSVHEGEVKEYTAPNGCIVQIKFEQLPYRYGNFGEINKVADSLVYATKRNDEWFEQNHPEGWEDQYRKDA